MTDILRVDGAAVRFGDVQALNGLDLRLGAGEWVALLGPNGAGKSTLMRAIAGGIRPDTGNIRIGGEPAGTRAARRHLGVVPQAQALYPKLSVADNLSLFGRLQGLRGDLLRTSVHQALRWSDLESRARHPAGVLSGGMQRRLSLVCGALHGPALLLADEPTAGVDAAQRAPVRELMARLRAAGTTILESTHELDRAELQCDRAVIMHGGRVVADGSVSELLAASRLSRHACELVIGDPLKAVPEGFTQRGSVLSGTVGDVARDLPGVLSKLAAAGVDVREVRVAPPRLEDAFLHVTGNAA